MRITYLDVTSVVVESGFEPPFSQMSNDFHLISILDIFALYTSDIQISYTHICCSTYVCPFVRCCVEGKICRKFALCFV